MGPPSHDSQPSLALMMHWAGATELVGLEVQGRDACAATTHLGGHGRVAFAKHHVDGHTASNVILRQGPFIFIQLLIVEEEALRGRGDACQWNQMTQFTQSLSQVQGTHVIVIFLNASTLLRFDCILEFGDRVSGQ